MFQTQTSGNLPQEMAKRCQTYPKRSSILMDPDLPIAYLCLVSRATSPGVFPAVDVPMVLAQVISMSWDSLSWESNMAGTST